MAFNGTEGSAITIENASTMTKEHRDRHPNDRLGHFYGREILEKILTQENCKGIRIYYGISETGKRELVLVGANEDENDLLDLVVDTSTPCPYACSNPNALNS